MPENAEHTARAVAIVTGTAAVIAGLLPVQLLALRWHPALAARLPGLVHRALCTLAGIKVAVYGASARPRGVLYVGNHVSWLDIPVLGAHINGAFVARADVAAWGAVGRLADLQRTIYVERGRRQQAAEQQDQIARRLQAGDNVILFPEGTSTLGQRVLPFRSALFAAVEQADLDVLIQPFSLGYTHLNGLPVVRATRSRIGWVGDMDLVPHAMALLGQGTVGAGLIFHPPVRPADFSGRKALASHCHARVSAGVLAINRHETDKRLGELAALGV